MERRDDACKEETSMYNLEKVFEPFNIDLYGGSGHRVPILLFSAAVEFPASDWTE